MALSVKRDGFKHVPWFSLTEWHEVYKEIYSNDTIQQTKAYERLLIWKSRLAKLPVGVECTLSIIQVCLRDRELTPKIEKAELPPYYENDLCLMYSTTIMRFLNHISNIGQTKQSSLFQIAKQLKIPEWIVNIRHDAAHGHELPSIGVLRIATNILLEWLHEEYWAAETKAMEKDQEDKEIEDENEPQEVQTLTDLIELWIAIGLYIHAGYTVINDVPDPQLKDTLSDLRSYVFNLVNDENGDGGIVDMGKKITRNYMDLISSKNVNLTTGQNVILNEISRYLSRNKSLPNKDDIILNAMFQGGAFVPNKEFLEIFKTPLGKRKSDHLPPRFTLFWQEFITLLHEKEILEKLILRLLKLVNNDSENDHARLISALWLKHIASSLLKIKLSQQIKHRMEQARENMKKKTLSSKLMLKVQKEVDQSFPEFKDIAWFNVLGEIPGFLTDINLARKIISNQHNKFSHHFVPQLCELITPSLSDKVKDDLLRFVRIFTNEGSLDQESEMVNEVKTIQDFVALFENENNEIINEILNKNDDKIEIGDQTIRNSSWTIAQSANFDWGNCPFGILPWQSESMEEVDTCSAKNITCVRGCREFDVVPGLVNAKSLTMKSKINWNSVLGKKKRPKRKRTEVSRDNIVDKAIQQIVKKQC